MKFLSFSVFSCPLSFFFYSSRWSSSNLILNKTSEAAFFLLLKWFEFLWFHLLITYLILVLSHLMIQEEFLLRVARLLCSLAHDARRTQRTRASEWIVSWDETQIAKLLSSLPKALHIFFLFIRSGFNFSCFEIPSDCSEQTRQSQ